MTEGFLLDRGSKEQRSLSPLEVQQVIGALSQHQVGLDGVGLLIMICFNLFPSATYRPVQANFNKLHFIQLL